MIVRARRTFARTLRSAMSEEGLALVLGLIVLLSLTALVLAFLSMSAFEPQIAQNLADTSTVRMLADSGIEFAYQTLVNTPNWNTLLVGATAATCLAGNPGIVLGAGARSLPGLPASDGTYTVRIRNDCQLGDPVMTGVLVEAPGNFTTDTNHLLIVQATGSRNTATHTITAVVRRVAIPNLTAALGFPGVQANVSGPSLIIDGRDTRLSDAPGLPTGAGAAVFGIAVSSLFPAHVSLIQTALATSSPNEVYGRDPNGPGTVEGAAAVTADAGLTSQMVIDFASAVKGVADVVITSTSTSPFAISDVGATCAVDIADARCWGTDAHPKIVYVKGDLASLEDRLTALAISGNSVGSGILVVENGTVEVTGNLQWHGPVILTGNNVGLHYRGEGDRVIIGGTIVNELHNAGAPNVQGAARMVYSKESIDLITEGLKRRLTRLYSWREK